MFPPSFPLFFLQLFKSRCVHAELDSCCCTPDPPLPSLWKSVRTFPARGSAPISHKCYVDSFAPQFLVLQILLCISAYIIIKIDVIWLIFVICFAVRSCSVMYNSETPWTVASQPPLPMGLSRQEYWGGLPGPPPGDLRSPVMEPGISQFNTSETWDSLPIACWHQHFHISLAYSL